MMGLIEELRKADVDLITKDASVRPMTEQEKEAFYKIPDGAIQHPDSEVWNKACQELSERKAIFEAGGNHPEFGLFWTYEKQLKR